MALCVSTFASAKVPFEDSVVIVSAGNTAGSGCYVGESNRAYIVATAYHVVKNKTSVYVTSVIDGKKTKNYPATVDGYDSRSDWATLVVMKNLFTDSFKPTIIKPLPKSAKINLTDKIYIGSCPEAYWMMYSETHLTGQQLGLYTLLQKNSISGESGCPVIAYVGSTPYVIGVMSINSNDGGGFVSVEQIRNPVETSVIRDDIVHVQYWYSGGNCQNGNCQPYYYTQPQRPQILNRPDGREREQPQENPGLPSFITDGSDNEVQPVPDVPEEVVPVTPETPVVPQPNIQSIIDLLTNQITELKDEIKLKDKQIKEDADLILSQRELIDNAKKDFKNLKSQYDQVIKEKESIEKELNELKESAVTTTGPETPLPPTAEVEQLVTPPTQPEPTPAPVQEPSPDQKLMVEKMDELASILIRKGQEKVDEVGEVVEKKIDEKVDQVAPTPSIGAMVKSWYDGTSWGQLAGYAAIGVLGWLGLPRAANFLKEKMGAKKEDK